MIKPIFWMALLAVSGLMIFRDKENHGDKFVEIMPAKFPNWRINWLDAEVVAKRTKKLSDDWRNYRQFREIREIILEFFGRGEISLCQTCEIIHNTSILVYPEYLRNLNSPTDCEVKTTIGRMVVRHFQMLAQENPDLADFKLQVEREFFSASFRKWCQKPWEGWTENSPAARSTE